MVFLQDYKIYKLFRLAKEDFSLAKAFLDQERNKLDKIEFFYPYKDEELMSVLDNGYFIALFDNEKIIATFALDEDEKYAKQLGDIVQECRGNNDIDKAYEMSGFMVAQEYRGEGIGTFMMSKIVDRVNMLGCFGCGVVHLDNVASMNAFLKYGYYLNAVKRMSSEYEFGYFINNKDLQIIMGEEKEEVELRNVDNHLKCLKKGLLGVKINNNRIEYREIKGI